MTYIGKRIFAAGLVMVMMAGVAHAKTEISAAMRTDIPDAAFVARYTPKARTQAALHLLGARHLGAPVALTPNQTYADGVALNIWKPSFVLGTQAGGEAGINFWGQHADGHINIAFSAATVKPRLLDCRFLAVGPVTYKIFTPGADTPAAQAPVGLVERHLLLVIPENTSLVELWPTPTTAVVGFFGCDLSVMD